MIDYQFTDNRGKTWQKPKKDHPWRRYANVVSDEEKVKDEYEIKEKPKNVKSMKIFIAELSESWDTIEVYTSAFGREDRFKLVELPQTKQAAWLSNILKRNYA